MWAYVDNGPILRTTEHQFGRHQNVTGDNGEYATKLWRSFPRCSMKNKGMMRRRRGPEPERSERGNKEPNMLPVIPSNKPKNQGAPPGRGPQASAVVRTIFYFGANFPEWGQDPRVGGRSATGRAHYPKKQKRKRLPKYFKKYPF